jgi:hypothetical protein
VSITKYTRRTLLKVLIVGQHVNVFPAPMETECLIANRQCFVIGNEIIPHLLRLSQIR